MNYFSETCILCLGKNQNLTSLLSKGVDGLVLQEKLKSFVLELVNYKPNIPKFVCHNCLETLEYIYKFRVKCLSNITTLNEHFQKLEHEEKKNKQSFNQSVIEDIEVPVQVFIKTEADVEDIFENEYSQSSSSFSEQVQEDLHEDVDIKNEEEAQNAQCDTILPEKSKLIYEKTYYNFKNWCHTKNFTEMTENELLIFFEEQSLCKKASSLWATYSMLKSTLILNENVDISKYVELLAFLKLKTTAYKPKKSTVFKRDEINRFLQEAPDDPYLPTKVIFVIGIAGGCRTDELCNMQIKDVDIRNDIIIINIPKTKITSPRKFILVDPLWIEVVKKYLSKRPSPDMERVFISFRHGKPTKQNIGHNTISKVPKTVATFLKLQNLEYYTGHSLRRTSAALKTQNNFSAAIPQAR